MDLHWQRTLAAFQFLTGWPQSAEPPEDYAPVLPYMVLPGIVVSLISLVVLGICHMTLAPLGATLFGTILLAGLWAAISRGHNLLTAGGLVQAVHGAVGGKDENEDGQLMQQAAVLIILLLKLSCLAILVYQQSWSWILLLPLCSTFYALEMSVRSGYFPQDNEGFEPAHRLALILFLAASLATGLRGVFVMVFVWLLCVVTAQWSRKRLSAHHAELINGGSEIVEVIVLLLGVIFLN